MSRRAIFAALATFATGVAGVACGGHVEVHEALLRSAPPVATPALVYMEGQGPGVPFYELGLVQAIGYGSGAEPESLIVVLTRQAAERGCQAIVRVTFDMGYLRGHASGVCVRFVGDPPASDPKATRKVATP